MVRVSQLYSLCLRHSARHPSVTRPNLGYAPAQVVGWIFVKPLFDSPRLICRRSPISYFARTRSGKEHQNPSGNGKEIKHDASPNQDLIDRINSLSDTLDDHVPSDKPSERSDDVIDPVDIYTATELETGNQDTQPFSALHDALGHDHYDGLSRFLPSKITRNRSNLSYMNVIEFENAPFESRKNDATSVFKGTGLRRILLAFMHDVEPVLNAQPSSIDPETRDILLEEALRCVFDDKYLVNRRTLAVTHYDVSDVACWSWVFSAPSVDLAVLRYVALMENKTPDHRPTSIPKFVLLQLVRSDSIGLYALRRLVECVLRELHICRDQRLYGSWRSWITRVIFVVRLLRHAHQTDPSLLNEIASIVRILFLDFYRNLTDVRIPKTTESQSIPTTPNKDELIKLAHIFNRFLGLMSLASRTHPFKWSLEQQKAQLKIVGIMAEFKPQMPVTREGFRALIKVQLIHKKTDDERAWAEAKSLSWPPWRQDTMGIQRDLEYSGKESRAMRLLRRMKEAGYSHGIWEQNASVLAGWDVDSSPTVQTRAILRRPRVKFFPETEDTESIDPTVWAARVRSTRTKLEAWAAFSAYIKSTPLAQRQYTPYYAMLDRLLAPIITPGSVRGSRYLPGDVKATFPEPNDPNQRVYVETRVPSRHEFYKFMLKDGFQPAGAILCALLKSAMNLEIGFQYIAESKYHEVIRDVLFHAEKYPHAMLKQNLNQLRADFLAAFYGLLCKYGFASYPQFQMPGSLTEEARSHRLVKILKESDQGLPGLATARYDVQPVDYASRLLVISGEKDITVWNGFLKGLLDCVNDTLDRVLGQSLTQSEAVNIKIEIWRRVEEMFNISRLESEGIHPDYDTFQHVAWLVHSLLRDAHFQSFGSARLVDLAKSLFAVASYGEHCAEWGGNTMRHRPLRVPDPPTIRILVRLLIASHDVKGILSVIQWLAHHANFFEPMVNNDVGTTYLTLTEPQHEHLEIPHLRGTLCAIRLFLEGGKALGVDHSSSSPESPDSAGLGGEMWFDTPLTVSREQIEQAEISCRPLRWPSDEEVRDFLARNVDFVLKVAQAADFTIGKERMYADKHE
ncbi:hypothetical protein LTR84_007652 [Exophiala bonariae]|uniref:Uncharacterized protein n=1 Tax=Exophiala bonariae TaxID=1690606 RepID=A0AAV9NPR4_9EURO|nr:hypothetical protein LTR84_007652 [Exophiala bonariae]